MASVRVPVEMNWKGFRGSVKNVQRDVDKFRGTMERQSRAIQNTLRFSIVFTGLRSMTNFTRSAQELEASLTTVKVAGNLTAAEMSSLREAVMATGAASAQMNTDVAKAAERLTKMGYSAKAVENALSPVVALAEATKESVDQSISAVGGAIAGLGLEMDAFGRVADVFTAGTLKSNLRLGEMEAFLKNGASAAKGLSLELEELTALAGIMADRNIAGAQAGTSLKSSLAALTTRTAKANTVLSKYGASVEIVNGNVTNYLEIIEALRKGNAGTTDIMQIFGTEGFVGAAALIGTAQEKWEALLMDITNSTGEAARVQKEQLENLAGSWKLFDSQIESVVQNLTGGTMLEFEKGVVDALSEFLKYLNNDGRAILKALGVAATAAAVALGTAGLGLAVNVVWKAFLFAAAPIRGGWVAIKAVGRETLLATKRLRAYNRALNIAAIRSGRAGLAGKMRILGGGFKRLALAMLPITIKLGLIAVAVGVVYTAFAYLYRYWGEITEKAKKMWGIVAAYFQDRVARPIKKAWNGVADGFKKVFDKIRGYWKDFQDFIAPVVGFIGDMLEKVGIVGAGDLAVKAVEQIGKDIKAGAQQVGEAAVSVGTAIGKGVAHGLETAKMPVQDGLRAMGIALPDSMTGGEAAEGDESGGGLVGAAGAVQEAWTEATETIAEETEDAFERVTRSVADSRQHVAREAIGMVGAVNSAAFKSARVAKGVAISDAIWNGARAVQRAFAEFPFPYSGIIATLMQVKTAAQIQKIKQTDYRGQAHSGLENVPSTGTYLLQQGEMVASRSQNAGLERMIARSEMQQGGMAGAPAAPLFAIPASFEGGFFTRDFFERLNDGWREYQQGEGGESFTPAFS